MGKPMKAARTPATPDMPRYKVLATSYIEGQLVGPDQASDEVSYTGVPGKHLVPLNDAAHQAKAKAQTQTTTQPNADAKTQLMLDLIPDLTVAKLQELTGDNQPDAIRQAAAAELVTREPKIDAAVVKITETDLSEVDSLIAELTDDQLMELAKVDDRKGVQDRVAKVQAQRAK